MENQEFRKFIRRMLNEAFMLHEEKKKEEPTPASEEIVDQSKILDEKGILDEKSKMALNKVFTKLNKKPK